MHQCIVRVSKASTTPCVWWVCMNSGLQLGRDNNYKCIWNLTALMLIGFSSKLLEKKCLCFYFIAANCDSTGTVTAIFQEACLELADLLVFMCVFIHAAVSFNCTWRGWYGCIVISVLPSQDFLCFFWIPHTTVRWRQRNWMSRDLNHVTVCVKAREQ